MTVVVRSAPDAFTLSADPAPLAWTRDGISLALSADVAGPLVGWRTQAAVPDTTFGVTPIAWYDVHSRGSADQIQDRSSDVPLAPLVFGSGVNAPLYLDADRGDRIYLPGQNQFGGENTIRQVGSTLTRNAAELDIRVALTLPDYTPASTVVLTHHGSGTTATTQTFSLFLLSSGRLRLAVSNGTTVTTIDSATSGGAAVSNTLVDGIAGAFRVTWRGSDGRVQFWQRASVDSAAYADMQSNSGWTQIGADRTGQIGNTYNGASDVGVLNYADGGAPTANASLWGFQLGTTIDGTPGLTLNPANCGQTGYTSQAAWTLTRSGSGGRKIVVQSPAANSKRDVVLAGVNDWLDGPTTAVPSATSSTASTVAAVIRPFGPQAAGKVIATTRATTTGKGVSIEMAGTNSVRAVVSDGTTTVTSAAVNITLGRRTVVGVILTGGSPGTVRVFEADSDGITLGATSSRTGNDETGGDLRCLADQAGGNVLDAESECPWIAFPQALTSAQIDRIWSYYDNSARAEVASGVTAAALNVAATNAATGAQASAGTATGLNAGASVTTPAQVAAGVTAAALNATIKVSPGAGVASATATANNPATNASTTAQSSAATAAANEAGMNAATTVGSASATAAANNPATNAATGAQTAAATAVALQPTVTAGDATVFAQCATVTAAANGATATVAITAGSASVTAAANGTGTNAATTAQKAAATATVNAAGTSVAASAQVATVTATATTAATSASIVVATVAAMVAVALAAQADTVITRAIQATFREATRQTFREQTAATFRETRQT